MKGGGIAATGGTLDVSYCRFAENYAEQYGAGISLHQTTYASIVESEFYDNTAAFGGGALFADLTSGVVVLDRINASRNTGPRGWGMNIIVMLTIVTNMCIRWRYLFYRLRRCSNFEFNNNTFECLSGWCDLRSIIVYLFWAITEVQHSYPWRCYCVRCHQ